MLIKVDNDISLWLKLRLATFTDTANIAYKSLQYKHLLENVKTIVIFIGYPRSGHSIVSSLIDAHPNAIISHRLDILKYLEAGYSEQEILYLIIRNSQRFAKAGRQLTGYKYQILNGWQGKFDQLHLIGDQEGKWTSIRLGRSPELLQKISQMDDMNTKFIHVARNPFDNIATWSLRTGKSLDSTRKRYFSLCENASKALTQLNFENIFFIQHEDFIYNFEKVFKDLCQYLSLEISDDYFKHCAALIYKVPHKSRHQVKWTPQLIETIERQVASFEFLKNYSFKD